MKTLARERDCNDLVRRLQRLDPGNAPRWGRMSAHQMVCHLSDALRMGTGEREVSRAKRRLPQPLIKWISLYLPIRWPAGIMTSPEIDQEIGGTNPRDFASDVAELRSLLDAFVRQKGRGVWPDHPIFGAMSEAEWFRWAYLHIDHHLRQFDA